MNDLKLEINSILQNEDIEGFIENGAPKDEYIDEATTMNNLINKIPLDNIQQKDIFSFLKSIWEESFNLSPDDIARRKEALERTSKQITLLIYRE